MNCSTGASKCDDPAVHQPSSIKPKAYGILFHSGRFQGNFWLLLKISKWHIESGSGELPQIQFFCSLQLCPLQYQKYTWHSFSVVSSTRFYFSFGHIFWHLFFTPTEVTLGLWHGLNVVKKGNESDFIYLTCCPSFLFLFTEHILNYYGLRG